MGGGPVGGGPSILSWVIVISGGIVSVFVSAGFLMLAVYVMNLISRGSRPSGPRHGPPGYGPPGYGPQGYGPQGYGQSPYGQPNYTQVHRNTPRDDSVHMTYGQAVGFMCIQVVFTFVLGLIAAFLLPMLGAAFRAGPLGIPLLTFFLGATLLQNGLNINYAKACLIQLFTFIMSAVIAVPTGCIFSAFFGALFG